MPRKGKVFDPTSEEIRKVRELPGIVCFSEVLQDNALVRYRDRQGVATLKGVDEQYEKLAQIDSILIDGKFLLNDEVANYANMGIGLAFSLGINAGFVSPLEIYAPKREEKVNMANPASSFNLEYAYIGAVFRTDQQVYDDSYMIVPLSLARSLFNYDKEVTAVELKVKDSGDIAPVKKEIQRILGDQYIVQDRFEQQEASFKMMQVEKWMTFLILTFILAIALFNVVGSLSMLMIEKQEDVSTLRNMGADDSLIRRIFLFEGWMISGFWSFDRSLDRGCTLLATTRVWLYKTRGSCRSVYYRGLSSTCSHGGYNNSLCNGINDRLFGCVVSCTISC